jgi:hypothetical protein
MAMKIVAEHNYQGKFEHQLSTRKKYLRKEYIYKTNWFSYGENPVSLLWFSWQCVCAFQVYQTQAVSSTPDYDVLWCFSLSAAIEGVCNALASDVDFPTKLGYSNLGGTGIKRVACRHRADS